MMSLVIVFFMQVDIRLGVFQVLNCDFLVKSHHLQLRNAFAYISCQKKLSHYKLIYGFDVIKVYIAQLLNGDQLYRISIQFQFIFICIIANIHTCNEDKIVYLLLSNILFQYVIQGLGLFTKLKLPKTHNFKWLFANWSTTFLSK